jgi:hypothetical protein
MEEQKRSSAEIEGENGSSYARIGAELCRILPV